MAAVEMAGVKVAFEESGRGEPVVLLHCSASSSAQWDGLREGLQEQARFTAPDLYGCGGTDPWPGLRPLRLSDEAALVSAVTPGHGQPLHLVGHSYGGAVALRWAVEHPERVRSLTLIEPVAFHLLREGGAEERRLLEEVRATADVVGRAVLEGDYHLGMARFVDYWNGEGAWSAASERSRRSLARCVAKVALDFHATVNEDAPLQALARFDLPVSVLRGERSPRPTLRIAELLVEAIPTARLQTVSGAGHMLPFTHPDSVRGAIEARLASAEEAERAAA